MMDIGANKALSHAGALLLVALVNMTTAAHAQLGAGYSLDWWTIDAGAGVATGGGYTLTGIDGQPEATPAASAGGGYTLSHGFLHPSPYPLARVGEWPLY